MKRFTDEDRIKLLKLNQNGKSVYDICQKNDIAQSTFLKWKYKFKDHLNNEHNNQLDYDKENKQLKIMLTEANLKVSALIEYINSKINNQ